jgi:hypothetical protein
LARSQRKGIRLSIEKVLIPELLARGFEQYPPVRDPQLSPFGRFRRRSGRGVELLEVRFNKNRTSHFHFHIALVTAESTVRRKLIPIDDQWPIDVDANFVVWRRGLVFRRWFGVKKYAREGISGAEYDASVMQAIETLPMIERYFARGRRTLAMEKFPQGLSDDLPYLFLCFVAVVGTFCALLWVAGWTWRLL